jgi:chromosome segregation protein
VFLKKITLEGFKSFADRTVFDIGDGVTVIVGPNGCGKSNVVDAVRWVLGEQSAKTLRGGRMQDVIFSGARSRQPSDLAEVTLTFDNTSKLLQIESEEVHVSRRLFRSGESVYRINDRDCRLRDIRELLMDTGVNVNAYSIIAQGRVDMLLQATPIERRQVFEEAAGISKVRARRTEAQRKLERTRQNLISVDSVLDEMERRLRSVKLQAGKARNFREYDSRLRELRSSYALTEYHLLRQEHDRTQAELTELAEKLATLRKSLSEQDAGAAELDRQTQQQAEQVHEAEGRLSQLQIEQSTYRERIAQGTRRRDELAQRVEQNQVAAHEIASRLDELHLARLDCVAQRTELSAATDMQDAALSVTESQRTTLQGDVGAARDGLEQEKSAAFEAVRRVSLLNNQQAHLTQQLERLGRELAEQAERLDALKARHAEIVSQRDAAGAEAAQAAGAVEAARQSLAEISQQKSAIEQRCRELGERVAGLKEQRTAWQSQLDLLEKLDQQLEGVDQGTRAILDWAAEQADGNVIGLVADVMQIDDPRLIQLQPLLDTFEQHILVRHSSAFVESLKAFGQLPGPLRVLALDRLVVSAAPVLPSIMGEAIRASRWVGCDDIYRPLAEYLLGRTYVVESRETALLAAAQAGPGLTFVTLDGLLVSADGQMLIASDVATDGLMSRKAEIRQLRERLYDCEAELQQAQRAWSQAGDSLADIELQQQQAVDALATAQKHESEKRTVLLRLEDEVDRSEKGIAAGSAQIQTLTARRGELEAEQVRVVEEQSVADESRQRSETRVAEYTEELRAFEQSLSELNDRLTEMRVVLSETRERVRSLDAGIANFDRDIQRTTEQLSSARQEANAAEQAILALVEELEAAQSRSDALGADLDQAEAKVIQEKQQLEALREQFEQFSSTARELHEQIDAHESQRHRGEVRLRESAVRQENLVARIGEELSLDIQALYADYVPDEEQDWEAVREEIETLRGKIARLGNVNLDALEELEALQPRFDEKQAQRDDVSDAIGRLEQLIEELDQESQTRFADTFEQVRDHFRELFRKLFGGGKADITLEDPDSPLECGIEIIARPPGKQPQSLSLLSGGEKTLTTVALILAVFKSKPSPFTILDEVDAALDEANVGRFNAVLQEFLEQSQFVVITHNKRTMQSADVLYGVTMQESGVSQRVSVRFDERVDTPHVA